MGSENRTHLFSSSAVFIGTLAAYYHIPSLMDVSPGKEIENKVDNIIKTTPGVEDFFELRLRKTGPFVYGQVKIAVRKSINVNQSHQIADEIEKSIKKKIPVISSFDTHVEPFQTDFRHLVIPVNQKTDLSSKLAPRFARAPYFLFANLQAKKIKGFYFLTNPCKKQTTKAGLSVAKLIIKQKSGVLITPRVGEIAFHTLHNYLVDIYQSQDQTARQAINSFIKNRLSLLKTPKKSNK